MATPHAQRPSGDRGVALLAAASALALALPACAVMRVGDTERRVLALERTRDSLRQEFETERKRLQRLHAEGEESSAFLREHGARISARLDALERKVVQLGGGLEELSHGLQAVAAGAGQHRAAIEGLDRRLRDLIGDLRDRAGIAILALPRELPEHADAWVVLAQQRFDEGEVRVADAVARECRKRFPGTVQAGRCGLIIGRIAFEEQRYGDATDLLRAVHDDLGGKPIPVVAQALLQIGEVMEAQGKCKEAKQILDYLRTLVKKGEEADVAKTRGDSQKGRCVEGTLRPPTPTSGSKRPRAIEGEATPDNAGKAGAAAATAPPGGQPTSPAPTPPAKAPPTAAATPATSPGSQPRTP